jgi:UDP-N-acetylmuramate dehydrogenase
MSLRESLDRVAAAWGGQVRRDVLLSAYSAFKVGGPADLFLEPETTEEVGALLRLAHEEGIPLFVLGGGTNLLVRDGGFRGIVLRLGKSFRHVRVEGEELTAGAIAPMSRVALAAEEAGLGGIEFGYDIPGTVGGALRMNAGAHGSEMSRVLQEARGFDPEGTFRRVPATRVQFAYRTAVYPYSLLFTEAVLALHPEDKKELTRRRQENHAYRLRTQPKGNTVGSIFKNPPGDYAGRLVEAIGMKGHAIGGARVSDRHGNWILNERQATARDIETLIQTIQERVQEKFGVLLETEVRIVGEAQTVPETSR